MLLRIVASADTVTGLCDARGVSLSVFQSAVLISYIYSLPVCPPIAFLSLANPLCFHPALKSHLP